MYATAHLDLVHATVAEQVRSGARATSAAEAPTTPARIRTWGPRASQRPAQVARPDVIRIPAARDSRPAVSRARSAVVLLDA